MPAPTNMVTDPQGVAWETFFESLPVMARITRRCDAERLLHSADARRERKNWGVLHSVAASRSLTAEKACCNELKANGLFRCTEFCPQRS